MLSMKHAASRPRPPLPSAASGSPSRMPFEIDAHAGERAPCRLHQAEVGQSVEQQPADEEFDRKIINSPLLQPVGLAPRLHPHIDDAVAHRERRCLVPVIVGRRPETLAQAVSQFRLDRLGQFSFQGLGVAGTRRQSVCFHWRYLRALERPAVGRFGGNSLPIKTSSYLHLYRPAGRKKVQTSGNEFLCPKHRQMVRS